MENKENKFTKGEWVVKYPNNSQYEIISEYGIVCFVPRRDEEGEANASLISSAPAMYEALKELQKQFNKDGNLTGNLYDICEAALQKATL